MQIDFKSFFKRNWIHFTAPILFLIATFAYFQPQFQGYSLKQHDIKQYRGMSNEINHFREVKGEEPLWTNSMFGGMPTYQISIDHHGNWVKKASSILRLWLSSPAGYFFAYLVGFYILLMCMKVNPYLAIFGAFAFAFSTYFIIILEAGHNTKAYAIGLMPPVIGAFYVAYRRSLKWGIILSALFMGMQLGANHFQITYYLGFILLALGIIELFRGVQAKQLKQFLFASIGILLAYGFAGAINYGSISLTNDYAKHTIRGKNDITISPEGEEIESNQTTGLDKDYITQWSYGVDETFTLISPYVKGGSSGRLKESPFASELKTPEMRRKASMVGDNDIYWGDQPFVSGPVYVGVVVVFLAILSLVYTRTRYKWGLLAATILAIILSWGKNFMGFTDFFLEYIPFYNKFRAVTIVLAVVELTIPLLGVLFLNQLVRNTDEIKRNIKPFYITSGAFFGFILLLTFTGLGDGYLKGEEYDYIANYEQEIINQLQNEDPVRLKEEYGIDINNKDQVNQVIQQQSEVVNKQFTALAEVREKIYQSSMMRSLLFLALGIGVLYFFIRKPFSTIYLGGAFLIIVLLDLVPVNLNYLNSEKQGRGYKYWQEKEKSDYPHAPNEADLRILEDELAANPELQTEIDKALKKFDVRGRKNQNKKNSIKFQTLNLNTNYRVYESRGAFSSSRASYFHKSLGGYHGAKLRRIQNLYDFHISKTNMEVFNMLNVRYFIQGNQVQRNPNALGNAWFIKEINTYEHPNDEIRALGNSFAVKTTSENAKVSLGNEPQNEVEVMGGESLKLFRGDSIENVDLSLPFRVQQAAVYVEDVNGSTNWLRKEDFQKDTTDSFSPILEFNVNNRFSPRSLAVMGEKDAEKLENLTYNGQGSIEMTSYQPNEMRYDVSANGNQFAVFSEVYYPDGWNAYIDGKQIPIHRVNYLLRGIELPDGDYELVMKFEVPKYEMGNNIAYAGSFLLFALIIGMFIKDFVLKRENE